MMKPVPIWPKHSCCCRYMPGIGRSVCRKIPGSLVIVVTVVAVVVAMIIPVAYAWMKRGGGQAPRFYPARGFIRGSVWVRPRGFIHACSGCMSP